MTDELRDEYKRLDFSGLVRGKYANRAARETNIIVLDPDIAEVFPVDAAVNRALCGLLDQANTATCLSGRYRTLLRRIPPISKFASADMPC
jgi:hypothetical protein